MKFLNLKTNETKEAFSAREEAGRIFIRFSENGKEYSYKKENIKMLESVQIPQKFRVYKFSKECYRCHKTTEIFTYIVFDDGTNEDLVFPWDKERLLKNQNIFLHMQEPSIEFYGLSVLGDVEAYDQILMEKFPNRIKVQFS